MFFNKKILGCDNRAFGLAPLAEPGEHAAVVQAHLEEGLGSGKALLPR